MLTYAYITLVASYGLFGEICVFAWGNALSPYVTENLNAENTVVIFLKFAYSLNLVCSYSIMIQPTNMAIENWLCGCVKNSPKKLYWA